VESITLAFLDTLPSGLKIELFESVKKFGAAKFG